MNNTVVSVVMAVNRDSSFLDKSIQSILDQTYNDFEFIIIANACTDELWNRLQKYTDSRIELHRTVLGQLTFNLNYGINLAKGEYIARMDDDDISLPSRFEKQVRFLDQNQEIDVLGTGFKTIDKAGNIIKTVQLPTDYKVLQKNMHKVANLAHPTIMARKNSIIEAGGYHISNYAEDYDLWLRMSELSKKFHNLEEPLLHYRLHDDQSISVKNARRNFAYVFSIKLRLFLEKNKFKYLYGTIFDLNIYLKNIIKRIIR